jgi:hypothetical protein
MPPGISFPGRGKNAGRARRSTSPRLDWFWWFGEDNVTEFDALFRGYLQAACRENKRGRSDG